MRIGVRSTDARIDKRQVVKAEPLNLLNSTLMGK